MVRCVTGRTVLIVEVHDALLGVATTDDAGRRPVARWRCLTTCLDEGTSSLLVLASCASELLADESAYPVRIGHATSSTATEKSLLSALPRREGFASLGLVNEELDGVDEIVGDDDHEKTSGEYVSTGECKSEYAGYRDTDPTLGPVAECEGE